MRALCCNRLKMKMRLWRRTRTRKASSLIRPLSCPTTASSSRPDDFQYYNTFCIDKVIVHADWLRFNTVSFNPTLLQLTTISDLDSDKWPCDLWDGYCAAQHKWPWSITPTQSVSCCVRPCLTLTLEVSTIDDSLVTALWLSARGRWYGDASHLIHMTDGPFSNSDLVCVWMKSVCQDCG